MGAWDFGRYRFPQDGRNDVRLGGAITSIKRELVYNGVDIGGVVLDLAVYGDAVRNAVKRFQAAHALTVDGEVGSRTATELFRKRISDTERWQDLPPGTLGKKLKLESGFDPAARGTVDHADRGISQINATAHPNVTDEQAYSADWSIKWAGVYIRDLADGVAADVEVLRAGRAAYNVGQHYASLWLLAGFPASGGPDLGGEDVFERATRYLRLVDGQTW